MIKSYLVGKDSVPEWLEDLVDEGLVTIVQEPKSKIIKGCFVMTSKEGIQWSRPGNYIKLYPAGTLTVERVGSIPVNVNQMVVHSS